MTWGGVENRIGSPAPARASCGCWPSPGRTRAAVHRASPWKTPAAVADLHPDRRGQLPTAATARDTQSLWRPGEVHQSQYQAVKAVARVFFIRPELFANLGHADAWPGSGSRKNLVLEGLHGNVHAVFHLRLLLAASGLADDAGRSAPGLRREGAKPLRSQLHPFRKTLVLPFKPEFKSEWIPEEMSVKIQHGGIHADGGGICRCGELGGLFDSRAVEVLNVLGVAGQRNSTLVGFRELLRGAGVSIRSRVHGFSFALSETVMLSMPSGPIVMG